MMTLGAAAAVSASGGSVDVPLEFDTRDEWYGCGLAALDQGQCGSCWAVGATAAFGERMCVWMDDEGNALPEDNSFVGNRMFQKAGACTGEGTKHAAHNHGCKRTAFFLSPQMLMSCGNSKHNKQLYPDSGGCQGGEARDAWEFFYHNGVSTMTLDGSSGCTPYTSGKCAGKDPNQDGCKNCEGIMTQCEDTGLPPQTYKAKSFGYIMEKDLKPRNNTGVPRPERDAKALERQIYNMQVELMTNGPLNVCMDFFLNFQPFFNDQPLGIYNSTEGLTKGGGHCLSIIGWGHDHISGFDYWLIKNSWGPGWGSDGVFRFRRGVDFCGIESDVWVGCPENSKCELTEGVTTVRSRDAVPRDMFIANFGIRGSAGDLEPELTDRQPSKVWRGGYWHELSEESLRLRQVGLAVAQAYELAFGEPTSIQQALEQVETAWTQVVGGGQRLRAVFSNGVESVVSM